MCFCEQGSCFKFQMFNICRGIFCYRSAISCEFLAELLSGLLWGTCGHRFLFVTFLVLFVGLLKLLGRNHFRSRLLCDSSPITCGGKQFRLGRQGSLPLPNNLSRRIFHTNLTRRLSSTPRQTRTPPTRSWRSRTLRSLCHIVLHSDGCLRRVRVGSGTK